MKRLGYLTLPIGLLSLASALYAQPSGRPARVIREGIDEARVVRLVGNTRPEATIQNDRGIVADSLPLDHMLLQLKRSPEREAALNQYIDDLHNAQSPNFHKWLTPDQFAEHYGVAQEDVATVTGWLKSHGFTVHGVQASGLVVDFSGTAGQVRDAYRTEIHNLEVDGARHFANMSNPQIPSALEAVVAGVVSLHNFHPKSLLVPRGQPVYNTGGGFHALVPGDIATIYNLNPLFAAGYSGRGQSIMVLEDTYLYWTGDWTVFRKTFGLTRPYPYGTLSQVSPTGAVTCTNPGFQGSSSQPGYGDDGEAILDVEWATAAAPNAAIILAACADTSTTFGGLIALQNTLNGPVGALPSVVSISYGEAEASNGAAANLAYSTAYQQAVAEGVSIFVSSGDEGAASADANALYSTHGIGVSGFTSTPYNVSVGGTDFGYTATGVPPSVYWSATNSNTYSSALSYIQEIPWNDSCAGALVTNYLAPFLGVPGLTPLALCTSSAVTSSSGSLHFLLTTAAGSGGPSGCATGTRASSGRVGGTCAGYAKPSWQSGLLGNPSDGVRDIPDVSLFASNGFWDAYYVTCWSNPDTAVGGGATCTGAPNTWAGFGGTSVSSPIMAGIQALVNQKTGSRWGNPNTTYYALAQTEYATAGTAAACNSTTVNKTSNTCIFYDITQGDIDIPCRASGSTLYNCYRPSDTYGVLSTSNTADQPAYGTNAGWDFSTGIGTINAWNLVMGWPTVH